MKPPLHDPGSHLVRVDGPVFLLIASEDFIHVASNLWIRISRIGLVDCVITKQCGAVDGEPSRSNFERCFAPNANEYFCSSAHRLRTSQSTILSLNARALD